MPRPRRSQRRHLRVVAGNAVDPAKVTPITVAATPISETSPELLSPRKPKSPPSPFQKGFIWCSRLGILGIGLGAIAGTTLTTLNPTKFIATTSPGNGTEASQGAEVVSQEDPIYLQELWVSTTNWVNQTLQSFHSSAATAANQQSKPASAPTTPSVTPDVESQTLKAKLIKLVDAAPEKIQPFAYFIDTDNNEFVSLNGDTQLSAASTIKIPVAIVFLEAVDQGKAHLHEQLPLTKSVIGSGPGAMQYQLGKTASYSALETLTQMIVTSDNTATNMIIQRLGGMDAVNQRFQAWQLNQTKLHQPLPDLEGKNTTSPQDLVAILVKLQQGEILSLKSRDRLLGIMRQTQTRTLLPQGLEPDAVIAHKTGDIGTILGDAGVIDMPSGKRYIGAVMATRPFNDVQGRELIQTISRTVYQHYKGMTPPAPATSVAQKPSNQEPTQ